MEQSHPVQDPLLQRSAGMAWHVLSHAVQECLQAGLQAATDCASAA